MMAADPASLGKIVSFCQAGNFSLLHRYLVIGSMIPTTKYRRQVRQLAGGV